MYGSVTNVITLTGLQPTDVGWNTTQELEDWLQLELDVVADMIEKDRNRSDFAAEGWLKVVDNVAERWVAAFVRFTMANRDSPIVRIDDFSIEMLADTGPGQGVLHDLQRIPRLITKRVVFESGVVKAAPENATGF